MRKIVSLFIVLGIMVIPYISNGDESSSEKASVVAGQSSEDESYKLSSEQAILIAAQGLDEPCQIDRDCCCDRICTQVGNHRLCRSSGGDQGLDEPCQIDRDCCCDRICTQVGYQRLCRSSP